MDRIKDFFSSIQFNWPQYSTADLIEIGVLLFGTMLLTWFISRVIYRSIIRRLKNKHEKEYGALEARHNELQNKHRILQKQQDVLNVDYKKALDKERIATEKLGLVKHDNQSALDEIELLKSYRERYEQIKIHLNRTQSQIEGMQKHIDKLEKENSKFKKEDEDAGENIGSRLLSFFGHYDHENEEAKLKKQNDDDLAGVSELNKTGDNQEKEA